MKNDFTKMEIQMYGMTKAQLDHMVKTQALPGHEMMFAAGMLSDAQELIGPDINNYSEDYVSAFNCNQARQFINCAKQIIFDQMNKMRGFE